MRRLFVLFLAFTLICFSMALAETKITVTGNGNATKEQVATMLRSILEFEEQPQYYDATDALAVAYTCHMQMSNPLADIRKELMPKKKTTKSAKKQWADFVNLNPDRVQ